MEQKRKDPILVGQWSELVMIKVLEKTHTEGLSVIELILMYLLNAVERHLPRVLICSDVEPVDAAYVAAPIRKLWGVMRREDKPAKAREDFRKERK